jgi:AbrB family looped-hinge helix DNA binding protein
MKTQTTQPIDAAMALVRIIRGGQITLPAEIRKALRIEEGSYLEAEVVENRLVLRPVSIMSREQAWRQIRKAQSSVTPTPEQAAKPVDEQEREIFEIVEDVRHRHA